MIDIYIKKSLHKVVPEFYQTSFSGDKSSLYRPAYSSLEKQCKEYGSESFNILLVDPQDIPSSTKNFLVCILDENSLIPDDYIARIIAMNNLHRDMSMICGPVFTIAPSLPLDPTENRLAKIYKFYRYENFSRFISCLLNDDTNNYPPINGCIFSGRHYNECHGYKPILTSRGILENNFHFLNAISKTGPIIYSEKLSTGYFITEEELCPDSYSTYFFNLGYYDSNRGVSPSRELLDIEYAFNTEEEPYLLELCKCMYNIGYFEGKTNNSCLI